MLRFLGFLAVYGVWIGLSGWALQRIMRGEMRPTYLVGALFWLVPPAVLYLLTGRGDGGFLLLTGSALPLMFVLGFLLRRYYGPQWQLVATLFRIGATLGARHGVRGCATQAITGLVMSAYPVLVGIWFFGDSAGAGEKIIMATFVLFVYLYFADVNTILMLAGPDTPPHAHSFLLWNRVLSLLPAGLMLALILVSLEPGPAVQGADPVVVGGVLGAMLLLSVLPYVIGWSRGRGRRLRGLADRQRLLRAAAEVVESGGDPERVLLAFEGSLRALTSRELVLFDVAQRLLEEADVEPADEEEARHLVRDIVNRRGMAVLFETDADFAEALLAEANGNAVNVVFAIEQYALTLLPGGQRSVADEEMRWLSSWLERLRATFADLAQIAEPAQRRSAGNIEASAMRLEVSELDKQRESLLGRRPVAAIVASLGAVAYSAGAGQLGEWAWGLAAGFPG